MAQVHDSTYCAQPDATTRFTDEYTKLREIKFTLMDRFMNIRLIIAQRLSVRLDSHRSIRFLLLPNTLYGNSFVYGAHHV